MTEDLENIEPAIPQSKKKGCLKKLFILATVFFSGFLIFIVALIFFIQTPFFKDWLIDFGTKEINKALKEKESKLYIDNIEGTIWKNIRLLNVSLVVKNDTLIKFDTLEADYNILKLLRKEIGVNSVKLINPELNFTKIKDKSDTLIWNFAYLLKKEKIEEDTSKKEFDWKIDLMQFELKNGSLRMISEKKENIPIRQIKMGEIENFGLSNFDVKNIFLNLSGSYSITEKNVAISHFSFNTNSKFNVKNISLSASIDKDDLAKVENLDFESDRSKAHINVATIENLNPLKHKIKYYDFREKYSTLEVVTDKFDAADLIFFLPSLDFMKGKVYADIKVKGKYGDIQIDKMFIKTNNSTINIDGRVKELNDPENLALNVHLKNSTIDPSDSKNNLPGLPIPEYNYVDKVYADIVFTGKPQKFDSEFDVRTDAGNVLGKGSLDITQKDIVYKTDFLAKNVNVSKILKDDKFKSNINANIIAEGRGLDYKTLFGKVNFEINGSEIYGQKISKSNGTINANNGSYDLNLDYASNSLITKIEGNIKVADLNKPQYNIKGFVQNFDISSITNDKYNKSNLNFTFNAQGEGYKPDDILGNFDLTFNPSSYQNYLIPSTPIKALIEKKGTEKHISFASDIVNFDAVGLFTVSSLPSVFSENLNLISDNIKYHFSKDSLESDENISFSTSSSNRTSLPDVNIIYSLDVRNIRFLHQIINDTSVIFSGSLNGEIVNNKNQFNLKIKGEVKDFSFKDSVLMFSNGILNCNFTNDFTKNSEGILSSNFQLKANDVINSKRRIDTLNLLIDYINNKGGFNIYGKVDTIFNIYSYGNLAIGNNALKLNMDTLGVGYKNLNMASNDKIKVNFLVLDSNNSEKVIDFESFKIYTEKQKLEVKGYYSLTGNSDLELSANRIVISDIQKFINPYIYDDELIKGNIRRIILKFKGSLDDPELYAETNTDMLSLQKFKLGRLDAIINYNDNAVSPEIAFYNVNNVGKLIIMGEIPLQNPLRTLREHEQRDNILDNEVNLKIDASNFQIKILEKILPIISSLNGNLNGKVDVRGKVKRPLLSGNLKVKKGDFKLDMTGVKYNFGASISAKDQRLLIDNLKVYFPYEEDKRFNITGYLDFTNLEINDIELKMEGNMKVLDNQVTQNKIGVYGDLYAKTSPELLLKGNPERLDLTGDMLLTKGRIYIPPFKKEAYSLYADNFIYKIIYDSSHFKNDSLNLFINKMRDSLKFVDKKRLDPFDNIYIKSIKGISDITTKKSPFYYDIFISTQDKIYTNLVIDEKTGQEFFGNVSTSLTFDNKNNDSISVKGRVNLEDNCYYKFYKNFKATGNLQFTGNIINPELNIIGEYDATSTDPSDNRNTRSVAIILYVSGLTLKPILNWKILVNDSPYGGDNPNDEAMSFIVFGRFKDELSAEQRINLVSSVGANLGSSLISQYLSNVIQTYIPFIINTDINYVNTQSGSITDNADIRITAELGDATIRFGGQILRDLSNTNITVEYPLNKILKIKSISNNLIFQFDRIIDPFSQNKNVIGNNRTGAMIFYRIKF